MSDGGDHSSFDAMTRVNNELANMQRQLASANRALAAANADLAASLAARDTLIAQLRHATRRIELLSDLLPVCAWCRRIEDADGRWLDLESFMAAHADVRVSHGMCPECAARRFPDSR